MPTRGIPFPAGDPSLDPEGEKAWRRKLLDRALEAVSTPVHGPTLFEVQEDGTAADGAGAPPGEENIA